jgi:hypothetical protein
MGSIRPRLTRAGLALALAGFGVVAYDAVSQVASAAPPPVITTGFATYPPAGSIPATCPADGPNVVQGLRFFLIAGPDGIAGRPAQWFSDPLGTGIFATLRSSRRFQLFAPNPLAPGVRAGDTIVARWNSWTPGCESLGISMPLKKTNAPDFDITDDQALVREPNGVPVVPWCTQSGADTCLVNGVNELRLVVPPPNVTCNFQVDLSIGAPLETVGPHGSYYQNTNRVLAAGMGLGTFNTTGPNMLLDALNQGLGNCAEQPRVVIDKQWVGSGAQPPTNVPPDFLLTVTSSASDTDPTVIGTATCDVVSGLFTCDYRDAADPSVAQGGLIVNANSLLNVVETGFPGNTIDVTFPVGMASRFINCPAAGGNCTFLLTNSPPPPPPTPPTTAPPATTPPPTEPTTSPETIPDALPPTGSSAPEPLTILGLLMVPVGLGLVWLTHRRADQI